MRPVTLLRNERDCLTLTKDVFQPLLSPFMELKMHGQQKHAAHFTLDLMSYNSQNCDEIQ